MAARDDARFMRLALRAGRRGLGRTSPNPPVGAVVVKNGAVVGTGFHARAGLPHAEVEALRAAGRRARGATLYVTLEPCNHHGRTPPCSEAVLAAGIRRVVIGTSDPNPTVAGRGAERLRAAGLDVVSGVLQRECDELIAFFRRHVASGLPFVTLKLAASLDGRIATAAGESRWITGAASRRHVHHLRDIHDAVLIGAETALADDPELTCRRRGGRNPLRVVVDGRLRLSPTAKLVAGAATVPTLVFTARGADPARVDVLRRAGVEVVTLPARRGLLAWPRMLAELGRRDIASVLVEGGGQVAAALLRGGHVDRLNLFLAPKLIGGDGRPVLGPLGVRRLRDALALGTIEVRRFSGDLFLATTVGSHHADEPADEPDR